MVPAAGAGSQHLWDLGQVLEREGWAQQRFKEKPACFAAQAGWEAPSTSSLGRGAGWQGVLWDAQRGGLRPLCPRHSTRAPLFRED